MDLFRDRPDLPVLPAKTALTDCRVSLDVTGSPAQREFSDLREIRETLASRACRDQEVFRDREERREKRDPWAFPENSA